MPDRTPAALITMPAGSAPDATVKPVALAFVATRLELYVTPWLVFARDDAVVHVGAVATIHVNVRSANAMDDVPMAVIVKVYDPTPVGVPIRAPAPDSTIPAGNKEPALTTYDDALDADRFIAVMAVPVATAGKVVPVTQAGVVDTRCVNVRSTTAFVADPTAVTV